MKKLVLLLFFCLPGFSQDSASKFAAAVAQAPKGYPVPFLVADALVQPAGLYQPNGCEMHLVTLGKVYFVQAVQMFGECHAFSPGTTIYGNVKQSLAGQTIFLLDNSGGKPKSRRYLVQNVELVNPSQQ